MTETREAGRELDALIAEKVMGIVWDESRCRVCGWPLASFGCEAGACVGGSDIYDRQHPADAPRHYSTDIAAAWLVVEKLVPDRSSRIQLDSLGFYGEEWRCLFIVEDEADATLSDDGWGEAPTAPLAICLASLAALRAVESSVGPLSKGDQK